MLIVDSVTMTTGPHIYRLKLKSLLTKAHQILKYESFFDYAWSPNSDNYKELIFKILILRSLMKMLNIFFAKRMARLHLYCKHEFYSRLSKKYRQLPIIGFFFRWMRYGEIESSNESKTDTIPKSKCSRKGTISVYFL